MKTENNLVKKMNECKCENCDLRNHVKSPAGDGMISICNSTLKNVSQSIFGHNAPRDCPKKMIMLKQIVNSDSADSAFYRRELKKLLLPATKCHVPSFNDFLAMYDQYKRQSAELETIIRNAKDQLSKLKIPFIDEKVFHPLCEEIAMQMTCRGFMEDATIMFYERGFSSCEAILHEKGDKHAAGGYNIAIHYNSYDEASPFYLTSTRRGAESNVSYERDRLIIDKTGYDFDKIIQFIMR